MTGLSRSEERLVRSLSRRKVREAEGLFVAEGIRVVEDLLGSPITPRLALVAPGLEETERGRSLLDTLRHRTAVRSIPDRELEELADTTTTQGVLMLAEIPAPPLHAVTLDAVATVLVLDGVQDPGNVGTLSRTAAAFGCDLLAILPGTVDPWNPKAVRSSAGAVFRYPVVTTTLDPLTVWLDAHGFVLLGADAAGESVESVTVPSRVALVLGNEGAGLAEATRERCERLVAVPMRGGTESLNVAVAGGILLYILDRERR